MLSHHWFSSRLPQVCPEKINQFSESACSDWLCSRKFGFHTITFELQNKEVELFGDCSYSRHLSQYVQGQFILRSLSFFWGGIELNPTFYIHSFTLDLSGSPNLIDMKATPRALWISWPSWPGAEALYTLYEPRSGKGAHGGSSRWKKHGSVLVYCKTKNLLGALEHVCPIFPYKKWVSKCFEASQLTKSYIFQRIFSTAWASGDKSCLADSLQHLLRITFAGY